MAADRSGGGDGATSSGEEAAVWRQRWRLTETAVAAVAAVAAAAAAAAVAGMNTFEVCAFGDKSAMCGPRPSVFQNFLFFPPAVMGCVGLHALGHPSS